MLSVEISKPKHFGKVLQTTQSLVESVVLEFSKNRLVFGDREHGGACIIFVEIRKTSSLFASYNYTFEDPVKIIKLDVNSLNTKLGRATKDHKVILEYSGGNHLIVKLIGASNKEFKIHLQEVSEGRAAFPKKAKDSAHVSLVTKPSLLEDALGDIATIKDDKFYLVVENDSITFKSKKSGEEHSTQYMFDSDFFTGEQEVKETLNNLYAHEHLNKILNVTKMSNYLNWKIVKNGPVLIGVQIAKDAFFWFLALGQAIKSSTSEESATEEVGEDESFEPESEADEEYNPEADETEEESEEDLTEDLTDFPDPGEK